MPQQASDSCGAIDSEGSQKCSRMEVARRWVAISHLHSDARNGREPSKDGQEDTEGGSRG